MKHETPSISESMVYLISVTSNLGFKVTVYLQVEYNKNGATQYTIIDRQGL